VTTAAVPAWELSCSSLFSVLPVTVKFDTVTWTSTDTFSITPVPAPAAGVPPKVAVVRSID